MKIIDLPQGSPEWLAWRKTVITATDASIIMGSNPWETPYRLWQRKLGLIEEKKSNEAMDRGKRLEPEARALCIEYIGFEVKPIVVESDEFDFLGASLDGISESGNSVVEIKCGGSKLHEMAIRGEIPQYYQDQMQHQLLVTDADRCLYYSYDGSKGICIEVEPDPEFKDKFLPKAREFWKCIALCEPPALQDSDYKDMSDNAAWEACAERYRDLHQTIKGLEESKEHCRRELLLLCGDQSCSGEGIKVMKSIVRGRIAYDAIPELEGVDLDKYRNVSTKTWKVLVS